METSRDDVAIAIRSAFLKKGAQQKFSLFVLIIISIALLMLDTFDAKPLNSVKAILKDGIYKGSQLTSIPGKVFLITSNIVKQHLKTYKDNELLNVEVKKLKKLIYETDYLKAENKLLREMLGEKTRSEKDTVISKVILDKESPFLHSFIINKGSNYGIKKGMPVLDKSYLVGRVVEVNYFSSRVLLLTDLNSKIPVMIEPEGHQAILSGTGNNMPILEFLPEGHLIKDGDTVYTSGKDGIFFPGIPIGNVIISGDEKQVLLLSDSHQLSFANIVLTSSLDNEANK